MRVPLSECHQSDSDCLARRKFEFDEPQPSGPAAVIGQLAHLIIERYTYEQAQHPDVAPMSVVRSVLAEHLLDPEVTGPVIDETVRIMAGAFDSDLRLGLPGEGWECVPEWRWALDAEFRPVAPCKSCDGSGRLAGLLVALQDAPSVADFDRLLRPTEAAIRDVRGGDVFGPFAAPVTDEHRENVLSALTAPQTCRKCNGSGWSAAPAYAGTVDRLEFNRATGEVRIYDWKSIILRESSEDIRTKRQPRWYSIAVLAHFPDVNLVTFYEVNLRYAAVAKAEFRRGESWEEQTKARMRAGRAARLHAIETGQWPEMPGTDCRWCPRLYQCGVKEQARAWGSEAPGTPAEVAGLYLYAKALHVRLEAHVKGIVEATQAPIMLPSGDALGMKPVKGLVMDRTYERAMQELRLLGMTPEQEIEWFRYVTKSGLAARVKRALIELCGYRGAVGFIDRGGWLDEVTEFEFSVWQPDATAASEAPRDTSIEALDAILDKLGG